MCRAARKSSDAGHGISGGLRTGEDEECSTKLVSAEEELKGARFENGLLITNKKEYRV